MYELRHMIIRYVYKCIYIYIYTYTYSVLIQKQLPRELLWEVAEIIKNNRKLKIKVKFFKEILKEFVFSKITTLLKHQYLHKDFTKILSNSRSA